MTLEFALTLMFEIGLLALLSIGVAALHSLKGSALKDFSRNALMGLMLGILSSLVMLDPVQLPYGATADARGGAAILSGVLAGPVGAIVTAVIGSLTRWYLIGGPVKLGGVVGFGLYALAGIAIGMFVRRHRLYLTVPVLAGIGLAGTLAVLPAFFVSVDFMTGINIVGKIWPLLFAANIVGTIVIGYTIDRLQRFVDLQRTYEMRDADFKRLARVASETSNGVIITGIDGLIDWVNDGFERMTGFKREDVIGQKPGLLLQGPETDPAVVRQMRDGIASKRGFSVQVVNYRNGGAQYWVRIDCQPIFEFGRHIGFMALQTDISESVSTKRQIERALDLYRSLVDAMPQWLYRIDLRGNLTFANAAYIRDHLQGADTVIGLDYYSHCWPSLVAKHRRDDRNVFKSGTVLSAIEEIRGENGAPDRYIEIVKIPIKASDGRVVGLQGVFWDVTERIASDLRNINARIAAEEANNAKTAFLANMSHELRTPLNAIIGFAEVLQMADQFDLTEQQKRDFADDISRSGHHLLDVINDLLDISAIEARGVDLLCETVAVQELIDDSCGMLREAAEKNRIIINKNVMTETVPVFVDQTKFRQCIINIVGNAIKYSPNGGVIFIRQTVSDSGEVTIEIEDNGIGIAADKIGDVFDPFTKAHQDPTLSHGGVGLGLPITKRLIEAHGGRLDLVSELQKGTVVTLVLPPERVRPMGELTMLAG